MKQRAIIALAESRPDVEAIAHAVDEVGATLGFPPDSVNVVAFLVSAQPSLIVADLDDARDWVAWALNAKSSPATRKIPILAFGASADARQRALEAGCDGVMSREEFLADPAAAMTAFARHDDTQEMLRQAALPLPDAAAEGIRQFNRHEFFEQHETFEHLWRAEQGPIRALYQGILQVGVAYLQIQRRNYDGARKLFLRARQYLDILPDVAQGVRVDQLRADAAAAEAELVRLGPDHIADLNESLFRPIQLSTPNPPL